MSKQTIESYQNQISKLSEENEELLQELQEVNEENTSKDEAIQKASMVIQMLREDLDKSVKDLLDVENERDEYKRNWKECQKQLSNLNSSRFKQDMEQQIRQFSSREKDLELKFEDERETNKLLQQQIDDMQSEIDELNHRNKTHQKELQQQKQQLKHLEGVEENLKQKQDSKDNQIQENMAIINNLKQSITELEVHYNNEIQLLKKVIENQNKFKFTPITKTPSQSFKQDKSNSGTPRKPRDGFNETQDQSFINRNTQSIKKSNLKKRSISQQNLSQRISNNLSMSNLHFDDKPPSNNSKKLNSTLYFNTFDHNQQDNQGEEYKQLEMKVKLLETEVQDSLDREREVIEQFERMVQSEAQRVIEYSKDIFHKEVAIRPEVERYLMMIEELKQKVNDQTITSINLSTLVKDSQIIQRLTMKSFIEQKIMFDVFIDKLEQHINKIEIEFLTLAKDSRENIYHECYKEIKGCLGKVKSEILMLNEQKQKDKVVIDQSKETNRQGDYSQRNRVDTLVSEAYNQIKEILQGGEYHEYDSTPQKGKSTPEYGNTHNNNNNNNNNNNVLFVRNTDSDQQITFEGRMSSQQQQMSTDQFDFNLHQNLIRRLYSLQEKVKSYEKILDEKLSLDKSGRNYEHVFEMRIDELEEEKLFFQVEREKYLLEKDQLIEQIITIEDQLMKVSKDMSENNNSSQLFNLQGGMTYKGQQQNNSMIGQRQANINNGEQTSRTMRMNELEKENEMLKQSNEGLRVEIEQLVIEMKEQQDCISKLEDEHQQTLTLTDQTILDLDQSIKAKELMQTENLKLKNIIQILEKTLQEQRDEIFQREDMNNQKYKETLDEIQKYQTELSERNLQIAHLKKQIQDTESIMQDYCEIIAASRGSKSEEDRAYTYKSSVENILSLLSKSLDQYSLRQSQQFVGKFKGFLDENYAMKMFIQKFQLFQEKISVLFRSVIHGLNKICSVTGCSNNADSRTSKSPRFDKLNRNDSRNVNNQLDSACSHNENASLFFSKSTTKFSDNMQKSQPVEIPESLDDMEQEFEKQTGNIIESYIRKESNNNHVTKILKFCRLLNEIAEKLISSSNNSDQIIINKLHRLFEDNSPKNVIIAEFQLSLMSILKHWKRSQNESSEIFYQLSFYLKSLVEEKDMQLQVSMTHNSIQKPDIAKSISILSQSDFFNEIIQKLQHLDKSHGEEYKNSISDQQQYKAFKAKLSKQLKQDIEVFIGSVDTLKEYMLIQANNLTQIKPFIYTVTQENNGSYVKLLQQFNKYLTYLQQTLESNESKKELHLQQAILQISSYLVKDLKSGSNNTQKCNNIITTFEQMVEICNIFTQQSSNKQVQPIIQLINVVLRQLIL